MSPWPKVREWLWTNRWPVLILVAVALFFQQCGQTRAARAAYDVYREEQAERERVLVEDLEDAQELAVERLEDLDEMVTANDELRTENADMRDDAQGRSRRAREAQPVAHANTEDALDEIVEQFPEAEPLVDVARGTVFEERRIASNLFDATVVERETWRRDAGLFRDERDEAIQRTIPSLVARAESAEALADEHLNRALRAELEYDREVASGWFDIGIPDWAGGLLGVGVGFLGGYVLGGI